MEMLISMAMKAPEEPANWMLLERHPLFKTMAAPASLLHNTTMITYACSR
jgi:hypothetical protein